MGIYKSVTTEMELSSALTCSDIESLRDEITEWRDNMDGSGLENTGKYDEVSECADALDNVDSLEDPLSGLVEIIRKMCLNEKNVSVTTYVNRRKGRGPARWVRLSNETSAIRAGIERAKEEFEKIEEKNESLGVKEETVQELMNEAKEYISELEGYLDELDGISFPGMY